MANCHVLIVEDDPDLRVMVATVLEYQGYTVREAANVASALRVIDESSPAVILLDAHVPGQLQQVGRALRDRHYASAVVAMTASPENFEDLTGIQPAAYLAKPFTIDDLARIVQQFCSPSRTRAA